MTRITNPFHVFALLFFWYFFGTEVLIVNGYATSTSNIRYFFYQSAEYPRDCREAFDQCSYNNASSGVFLIKPDQISEPIQVYCENNHPSDGWTVIQRRLDGSINFNRTWEDYKRGFGFIGSEFWIGNERLAFLTNQNRYSLRIDFQYMDGQSHYITYDNFRITDEWDRFSLYSLNFNYNETKANYSGCYIQERDAVLQEGESYVNSACSSTITCTNGRLNSQRYSCSNDGSCQNRNGIGRCVCNEGFTGNGLICEPRPCYVREINRVLSDGETYINPACTRNSTCNSNNLNVQRDYSCSNDATCDERNGVRKCYCNDGFEGDGVTCTPEVIPKDCQELFVAGTRTDGVYTIYPDGFSGGVQVYCEMESNGGGWMVFQRRSSSSLDFYRVWSEYKNGFGSPSDDHWLGNKYIYAVTNQKSYQLRIELRDSRSSSYYALYSSFRISNEADKYRLSIGSYSGNAGSNAMCGSNNRQFSTRDQDNDGSSSYDCAEGHRGAWWFAPYSRCGDGCSSYAICSGTSCNAYCRSGSYFGGSCNSCRGENYCDYFQSGSTGRNCGPSHLNGDYDGSARGTNIYWSGLSGYDCGIQYTEMKIRPV